MVVLATLRELHPAVQFLATPPSQCEESLPQYQTVIPQFKVEVIPLIPDKTQCIYGIGEGQLPYNMCVRSFKRVSHDGSCRERAS